MTFRSILAASAAVLALSSPQEAPSSLLQLRHVVSGGDHQVQLQDGSAFATLRLNGARIPYLWPVVGPSGDELTRAFPMETGRPGEAGDHPHHQSFWFTHGDVNGHDFWHDPDCRIAPDPASAPEVRLTPGFFEVEIELPLVWSAPEAPSILNETRTYRFASRQGVRLIECESVLTAKQDVTFGDTKEGSFALRLRPELRLKGDVATGSLLNSSGQTNGDCWGQRAAWVSYETPLNGHHVGVTVMDHAMNLRHPTWWHARDYGLVAANPFGTRAFEGKDSASGEFTLQKGKSLTQRYLVVLSGSDETRSIPVDELKKLWSWWTR
ncbi:MAG: hypothetical protein ACJA0P_000654 [Planctomycetota bacterium]|jgi:hypothetical protein